MRALFVLVVLLGSIAVPARAEYNGFEIDFSQFPRLQNSLSGFLLGIDNYVQPDPRFINWLQPRLWRGGADLYSFVATHTNASFELIGNEGWGVPSTTPSWAKAGNGRPPYNVARKGQKQKHEDWVAYDQYVGTLARQFKGQKIFYEFWNEPDLTLTWPSSRVKTPPTADCENVFDEKDLYVDLFFQTYQHFYQGVRKVDPAALVGGPSLNAYCAKSIQMFLDFALANHLEVNFLTWHEIRASQYDIPSVQQHLVEARAMFLNNPKYRSLNLSQIHINESGGPDHAFRPGEALAYLYYLEQGGADFAGRSCWAEPVPGSRTNKKTVSCRDGSVDGIFTPGYDVAQNPLSEMPRAAWWAYLHYASILAQRIPCNGPLPGNSAVCFAGHSFGTGGSTAKIIVASYDNFTPATPIILKLDNLQALPFLRAYSPAQLTVERIPADSADSSGIAGTGAVLALPIVYVAKISAGNWLDGGQLIQLPPLAAHEAFVITITLPGNFP